MVSGDPKYRPRQDWVSKRPSDTLFFLDSGAHSLYTREVIAKKHRDGYAFYDTPGFWAYVDSYAEFVKLHKSGIDYYANVDVIFDPHRSWKVQKYLEEKHGLSPVPVIHYGTDLKWVKKHLDAGYEFLGIGGLGQEATAGAYKKWADQVFAMLCPRPKRLPRVRTHGFAMTSYDLIMRYPWWSVDSSSWAKSGAYGSIYVPHKRKGSFTFTTSPYVVNFSHRSPAASVRTGAQGKHFYTYPAADQRVIREWLDLIEIPLGAVDKDGETMEEGVINHYGSRGIANLRFFEAMCASLPEWPWPFGISVNHDLFSRGFA